MTPPRRSRAAYRHANVVDLDPRKHENRGRRESGPPDEGTLLDVLPLPETGKAMVIVAYVVPASEAPAPPAERPLESRYVTSRTDDVTTIAPQEKPTTATRAPERRFGAPALEGLRVDRPSRRVWADGREVGLTYQEFELLHHLTTHPWTVFSRAELMTALWPAEYAATRTVDVHVHRLRRKLGREGRRLATVRRIGYVYRPHGTAPADA